MRSAESINYECKLTPEIAEQFIGVSFIYYGTDKYTSTYRDHYGRQWPLGQKEGTAALQGAS